MALRRQNTLIQDLEKLQTTNSLIELYPSLDQLSLLTDQVGSKPVDLLLLGRNRITSCIRIST